MSDYKLNSNPFWQCSLTLYQNESIEMVLLELQDSYALNVNIMLFCLWLASINLKLTKKGFQCSIESVDNMQSKVTTKLRSIRRSIKSEKDDYETLYESILRAEIYSERIQQDLLYQSIDSKGIDQKNFDRQSAHNYLLWLCELTHLEHKENLFNELLDQVENCI